jgi:hypothetical protein
VLVNNSEDQRIFQEVSDALTEASAAKSEHRHSADHEAPLRPEFVKHFDTPEEFPD